MGCVEVSFPLTVINHVLCALQEVRLGLCTGGGWECSYMEMDGK